MTADREAAIRENLATDEYGPLGETDIRWLLAELAAARERHHHEKTALLAELDAVRAERDEARAATGGQQ